MNKSTVTAKVKARGVRGERARSEMVRSRSAMKRAVTRRYKAAS